GAILGPLLMAIILQWRDDYRFGFLTLLAPALLTLLVLLIAWRLYPQPQHLELAPNVSSTVLPRRFWRYLVFASLVVAGFPHFQLLAYHFKVTAYLPEVIIPAAFGLAMATDAIAALAMGRWFDRIGLTLLVVVPLLTFVAALALFTHSVLSAWLGMVLWGIVMGAQESVMRAAIAEMAARERRASVYGVFNAAYGLAWLLGGTAMGWLYDHNSISGLLTFIALTQIVSLPLLFSAIKPEGREAQ
ncbi:MAG: MFS transporter, partial [Armatimonadota bacterium]